MRRIGGLALAQSTEQALADEKPILHLAWTLRRKPVVHGVFISGSEECHGAGPSSLERSLLRGAVHRGGAALQPSVWRPRRWLWP